MSNNRTSDYHHSMADDPVDKARQQWDARYPEADRFTVVVSMLRTYALMIRELEAALRPVGLNLSRFEVLLLLSFTRDGQLPIMRLRDLLLIHGSSATYLVDRLGEAGLVERRGDPADRRVSVVCLTDSGREAMEAGVQALLGTGFGSVSALGPDDRRDLARLLAAMRTSVPAGA